jgi:glycosyltransferase involved in cell wall biosynthesis
MESPPILSVLMPVYNGRDYLRPAIDSILAQSFRDFELIIVNDGSADDTQAIIDGYRDPRIVSIVQQNQGVARSLNNGLEVARGKYVRRHDADDVSTADSFEIQVRYLDLHPEYVMVCNQEAFMTASGRIAWKYRVPNQDFFKGREVVDLDFSHFSISSSSPVVHGTACYRREEVIRLGKYRTEFTVSEDNDLWLRLLEKHKIAVLNQCTYFMRLHGASATQRHAGKIKHFRQLLIDYSRQRRETGSDPIMRGEPVPPPPVAAQEIKPASPDSGRHFREDLRYLYGLVVDAGDWSQIRKIGGEILRDGWKDGRTWKMLAFPLVGERFVKAGVSIKSIFRQNRKQ